MKNLLRVEKTFTEKQSLEKFQAGVGQEKQSIHYDQLLKNLTNFTKNAIKRIEIADVKVKTVNAIDHSLVILHVQQVKY